eukprot:TRINITY_DN14209_c1_g3_i1.p1 TRINITY_DN14209_c1_g3~~TRINITY_DN14209_c1_g3_i1.p1  ORF type:complete len:548 (+),score=74.53 TRINITY_DN14209_c1_g3_i1:84-1646(+)
MTLLDVKVAVWPADKFLEEKVQGQLFQDTLSVLNPTHMVALIESRLQKGGVPLAVGRVEYYDEAIQKWMDLIPDHDLAKFSQPVKMRVWSRRRKFLCKVYPLRGTVSNYAPRSVSFFALNLKEFEDELRARLPPSEQDFKDILHNDPRTGWVLLETLSDIPVDAVYSELKLIPKENSLATTERREESPLPPDLSNYNETQKLQHIIALESARKKHDEDKQSASEKYLQTVKEKDKSEDRSWMPTRLSVKPMLHTTAEVSYLHNEQIRNASSEGRIEDHSKRFPDPNRDECCYPGSGQVHSMESSGHGDLKRQVISYIRTLLQDVNSPLVEYLSPRGLPTNDLVNVTALVAHHFLVRSPCRPGFALSPEDKAHIHSLMAHVLLELPHNKNKTAEMAELARAEARSPPPQRNVSLVAEAAPAPQVVLMRPLLSAETVVIYGTVSCANPVECKWFLRTHNNHVDIEKIFERGFATTEPVSSSSFSLKLLPGSLIKGVDYHLTLQATSDPGNKTASATQKFSLP